jgi:ATP-dependent Lon protease
MTGEITLRGEVLPIGGLKEKLLAAVRGGIRTTLIPEENVKDLVDIPENIKNVLEILPVKWIDQVLELALERKPEPLPESAGVATVAAGDAPAAVNLTTH